jgi:hypothetical protein
MSNDLRVAHCPGCGNIYQINMRNLCSKCSAKEDSYATAIEQTMRRNRQLNVEELSEAADVPQEKIRALIRLGRIRLFDYPNLADQCDVCAGPIRKGTMCKKCSTRIQDEIAHELEQERLLKERRITSSFFSKN